MGPELLFSQSTRYQICSDLMARDPYESRTVVVRQSREMEGGEGLFAARDRLGWLCYYNRGE